MKSQLKKTTDATLRKKIISDIKKSKRTINKAEVLLLENGSSKSIAKNLKKIVDDKKSKIAKINSKIEKLRNQTNKTPETLKRIEKLSNKVRKIEKEIKKVQKVAERSVVKRSSYNVAIKESKRIIDGKKTKIT